LTKQPSALGDGCLADESILEAKKGKIEDNSKLPIKGYSCSDNYGRMKSSVVSPTLGKQRNGLGETASGTSGKVQAVYY
jgi:hypothetical protein